MSEEFANSETVVGVNMEQNQNSVEATIESSVLGGGTESTCNNSNNNNNNKSAVTSDGEREKSLEHAEELMARGSKASKEGDYGEAAECYSRALEIRAAHFGELAPECVNTYYKYGCALLYKAQEEADPLGAVPKKDDESQQKRHGDESVKSGVNGESSVASVSSNAEQVGSSVNQEKTPDGEGEDQEEEDSDEGDAGDVAEAEADEDEDDEDDSDLDLAWKMLDVARAIAEKNAGDTMDKVDILSALAEVALEREDVETSLSDYLKALSILERLVEPDTRHLAELNFRICLCLETGSKPQEAIPHCQKAISVCKTRVQRLTDEVKSLTGSTATSELDQAAQQSSSSSQSVDSIADKESEIETLTGLASELEKKLEDLQHLVSNPSSILTDILAMVSAKAGGEKSDASFAPGSSQMGTATSSGGVESPTVSTAHTNGTPGVTHLGVVGRGVKRVNLKPETEQGLAKKPLIDPLANSGDGSAS